MSRVGKQPINLPKGVSVMQNNGRVTVKGPKGELHHHMHRLVNVVEESGVLTIATKDDSSDANMQSGTARALLNNTDTVTALINISVFNSLNIIVSSHNLSEMFNFGKFFFIS